MCPRFRDLAIFDDQDPVGALDRRKAVRDDKRRPPVHQRFQTGGDHLFRDRIDGAYRLILS